MKQTAVILSTYAADISGVCSAMYELGGMTVMHDASGCNSTYTTHDEPRWYDQDSHVLLSGLTETEAILGKEDTFINNVVSAAERLKPKFVTFGGTPIPRMMGFDFEAVARKIQQKVQIPVFGIATDGMHSYVQGASKAMKCIAETLCEPSEKNTELSVNLLGATPLDFSMNGTIQSMKQTLEAQGIGVHSIWTMGTDLEKIKTSAAAAVNLVISSVGLEAGKVLKQRFGMPYVIGTPYGKKFTSQLAKAIREAAKTGQDQNLCKGFEKGCQWIIGETVTSLSLAQGIYQETGEIFGVLSPVGSWKEAETPGLILAVDEEELRIYTEKAKTVIADPMYAPICGRDTKFWGLPHEAFSGRIYRKQIPNLAENLEDYVKGYMRERRGEQ